MLGLQLARKLAPGMKREKGMTLLNYYYCYYYYISKLLLLFPRCKKRSKNFLYDIDQIFIQ